MSTYEVTIDTGPTGLQRFAQALFACGATMGRRLLLGPLGRGSSAVVMVEIDDDRKEKFLAICRPRDFRLAKTAHVNAANGEGDQP